MFSYETLKRAQAFWNVEQTISWRLKFNQSFEDSELESQSLSCEMHIIVNMHLANKRHAHSKMRAGLASDTLGEIPNLS